MVLNNNAKLFSCPPHKQKWEGELSLGPCPLSLNILCSPIHAIRCMNDSENTVFLILMENGRFSLHSLCFPPPVSTSATSRCCCGCCPSPGAPAPVSAGADPSRCRAGQRSRLLHPALRLPCHTGSSFHQWFSLFVFKIYRILGLFIHILH